MTERKVKRLLYSTEVSMGGIPVRQPLPTQQTEMIDPFLLIHHHSSRLEPHTHPRSVGVGPHPHRGFSPVTFIYKGDVHHRDSRGHNQVVAAGGVQWINSGMGIIHAERPSAEFAERGGEQEIIQIWINTPAKDKMQQPAYFPMHAESIPRISESGVMIQVVAGKYKGVQGFSQSNSPLLILKIEMQENAKVSLEIPESFNACLYNMDAVIDLESFGMVEPLYLTEFEKQGDQISISARGNTRLLLLAGQPLNEPVVSYGPFVMNTQTQIMEAMRDYQMGKMGMLED